MTSESGRDQWFDPPKPLALSANIPCGNVQLRWPHKICKRDDLHEGDHCCRFQAGNKIVEVWWSKDEWREVAVNS